MRSGCDVSAGAAGWTPWRIRSGSASADAERGEAEDSGADQRVPAGGLIPVPCHPDSLGMAYAMKLDGKVVPLTGMIEPDVLINAGRNTVIYEQEEAVRSHIFKLFATNHSPQAQAATLRELLCCLPQVL